MSLEFRDGRYYIDLSINGKRFRKSTKTGDEKLAKRLHAEIEARLYKGAAFGDKPDYFWIEAVDKYIVDSASNKSLERNLCYLTWINAYWKDLKLCEISRERIEKLIDLKKHKSPATRNRILQLIRAILHKARDEWEYIEKVPKITLYKEPPGRTRWLSRKDADLLVSYFLNKGLEHLADGVEFSLQTGLRESNVATLLWSEVDLQNRVIAIPPEKVKTEVPLVIPLSDIAIEILERNKGKHPTRVFTYNGKPVTRFNTKAWRIALTELGIKDFRFHDLRHTWASWHVQHGTPLHVLQKLGGWSNLKTVMRYAHLTVKDLAVAVNSLEQAFNGRVMVESGFKLKVVGS